jgi:uncharacterized protein (TIGR03084 family)
MLSGMGSDGPTDLAPLLDDLAAEQLVVDDAVTGLDDAGWDLPTPAPGWSIRHQISHLTTFDEQGALAATDPVAFEAGRDAALADRESFDTAGPYVRQEPAQLLGTWRAARAALRNAFAGRDPRDRLPWYGPPMSARSFLTARLMEAWAHGVDITDALGRPPSASARLRHVAHLGVVTRGWSYAVRGAAVPAAEVHVVLLAPDGDTWTWGAPTLDDRIEGPALDFCLAVTQRRPLDQLALTAAGDAAAGWLEVAQAFAGGPTRTTRASGRGDRA